MEENNIQKPSVEFITTDLREASKVLEELGNYRHANMCISACCELTDLQSQLQQYKQRIDELEKEYIERIGNGVYNDIYVIEDDNYYVNGETLLKEVLDDLSKLKERDEK